MCRSWTTASTHSLRWCEIAKWKTVPSMRYRLSSIDRYFRLMRYSHFPPRPHSSDQRRKNRWPNQRSTDDDSSVEQLTMNASHNELKWNEIQKRFIGRIDAFDGGVAKSTQTHSIRIKWNKWEINSFGNREGKNMNLFIRVSTERREASKR